MECTDPASCGSASPPLTVLVSDFCAGCGASTVFLSPSAYGQIVASSLGKVAGRFRRVRLLLGRRGACVCVWGEGGGGEPGGIDGLRTEGAWKNTPDSWGWAPAKLQVNCAPPRDISVHVADWRTSQGGWLRLALLDVAGGGDITRVQLSPSPSPGQVGHAMQLTRALGQHASCAVRALVHHWAAPLAGEAPDCTRTCFVALFRRPAVPAIPLPQAKENWLPMKHSFGATWELSSLPAAPLDLQATDGSGQVVVAR